ncbi:MAG TPA: cation diffusion facilitator family transporter [Planctomycetota bacterium]|nr:cation diffusion facilitator family transporter [Planctomycetota bacterium]
MTVARERAARFVFFVTLGTMAVELVAGYAGGSMALVADGWHMSSHAAAMFLAWLVYAVGRRSTARGAALETRRLHALGGYTSALLLAFFAVLMAVQSVDRLQHPVPVDFGPSLGVAVVGLLVNLWSAIVLHRADGDEGHGHDHADDAHAPDAESRGRLRDRVRERHARHDHNQRAAIAHVAADALTSVLAIAALTAGRYLGWAFLDPTVGLLGAALVLAWSGGLVRASVRALLAP